MMQLAALETELGEFDSARQSWDRFIELSPLLEKALRQWLAGRRSDAAYYCGDYDQAAAAAPKKPTMSSTRRSPKSCQKPAARGSVCCCRSGFVRQHHMTCVPATLATVSRYWSMPGGPPQRGRGDLLRRHAGPQRAELGGGERLDHARVHGHWESAMALLDRGVPFTWSPRPDQRPPAGGDRLRQPARHAADPRPVPSGISASSSPRGVLERWLPRGRAGWRSSRAPKRRG